MMISLTLSKLYADLGDNNNNEQNNDDNNNNNNNNNEQNNNNDDDDMIPWDRQKQYRNNRNVGSPQFLVV